MADADGLLCSRHGCTLWFTGPPGVGKSTLSRIIAGRMKLSGYRVERVDSDDVRPIISPDLGYTKEDRDLNVQRLGYIAGLLARNGIIAIVASVSPYRAARLDVRRSLTEFVEIYVTCNPDVLLVRDPKGLYRDALANQKMNVTGISDPYEAPNAPEVIVDTSSDHPEVSAEKIWRALCKLNITVDGKGSTNTAG
jgi:adenylylsulfate kinase